MKTTILISLASLLGTSAFAQSSRYDELANLPYIDGYLAKERSVYPGEARIARHF
jgi:hypothetical protein